MAEPVRGRVEQRMAEREELGGRERGGRDVGDGGAGCVQRQLVGHRLGERLALDRELDRDAGHALLGIAEVVPHRSTLRFLRGSESVKVDPCPGSLSTESRPAQRLGQLARDREAEAGAALAAAAVERVEDGLALGGCDARGRCR